MKPKPDSNLPIAVIYHANCADGWLAAYLFAKAFPGAQLIPASYGQDPPSLTKDQPVVIVDFSYRRSLMEAMDWWSGGRLLVLDHHKSAAEECKGLSFCIFDMNRSGARMALDNLAERGLLDELTVSQAATLVDYVQDRDLWRHELPCTHEVNAALRSFSRTIETWDRLLTDTTIQSLIEIGTHLLREKRRSIDAHVKRARMMEIAGVPVLAVSCTHFEVASEVGEELAKGRAFGATYYDDGTHRMYSLRSDAAGVDVSKIAVERGGGGHKHAAGFRVEIVEDPFIVIESAPAQLNEASA